MELVWMVIKMILGAVGLVVAFLVLKVGLVFARYFRLKRRLNVTGLPNLFDTMSPIPALKAFALEGLEKVLHATITEDQKEINKLVYAGGFIDGTPWFIDADADDIKLLVEEKNFRKLPLGYDQLKFILGEGLVTSSGDLWKRQRRLISPLFHFHNLKPMAETIHRDTVEMMKTIKNLNGAKISPFNYFSALTLQIVIDSVFGGRESGLDVQKLINDWAVMTKNMSQFFLWTMMFDKDIAPFLPFPSIRTTLSITKHIRSIIRTAIQTKRRLLIEQGSEDQQSEGGDSDLITSLLKVVDPETGERMPEDLIIDEAITFLFAGHDTTSNALAWCMYFLARRPDVVERLREELYSVFPDFGRSSEGEGEGEGEEDQGPSFDDLKQLHFFRYTLMETMRIRPPVPFVDREAVQDCELQGVKIPAGTVVSMSFIGAHHDPRFWKDPFEFRPDRFDPANKDQEPARHAFSFLPFSAGGRNCVGQKFAMLDATIILMHIVHNFDVSSDPKEKVDMFFEGTMTPFNFHAQFHPRSKTSQ